MIVEGKMQYLFDERGRRYLDVRPFIWLNISRQAFHHSAVPFESLCGPLLPASLFPEYH